MINGAHAVLIKDMLLMSEQNKSHVIDAVFLALPTSFGFWGKGGGQCHFSSAAASSLKTHKLRHSRGKPYECDQCKHSSKMAQNLKTHKVTHSGEKPYACDQYKYSSAMSKFGGGKCPNFGGGKLSSWQMTYPHRICVFWETFPQNPTYHLIFAKL